MRFRFLILFVCALMALPLLGTSARAQDDSAADAPLADGAGLSHLRFLNPRERIALPEPMPGPVLRFVVADDFPPFAFTDGQGRLAGVHIDLIRGLCATLELPCTLQARRFDQVLAAIDQDPNNLILAAGLAVNADTAQRLSFSLPYYRYAARFISLQTTLSEGDWMAQALVGAVENTAHAAFLQAAYGQTELSLYSDQRALYSALRRGDITHAFGDGLDFAFWMASTRAADCCQFVGTPLFSRSYFGEGLTFAVPRGQRDLLQAINAGLVRMEASGELETIMLTAFPLDPLGR